MERLTKEQIQFIDDRLYNMGVKYVDIRYEMVDHIASELETMEGDFGTNWTQYFMMHSNEILKQNKRARRTAILRAIKLYFKTMAMPMVLFSSMLIGIVAYYVSFLVDDKDLNFLALCILMVFALPAMWLGRKNQKLSVMRPLAIMYGCIFNLYQIVQMFSYSFESDASMYLIRRINVIILPALMLVLIVSLYRCRKQYVGKYI